MTTTLNGWTAITVGTSSDLANGVVPGTKRRVTTQKDCLPLFLAYLADWHKIVMPIDGFARVTSRRALKRTTRAHDVPRMCAISRAVIGVRPPTVT